MREIGTYEGKRVFELSKKEYDNLNPIKDTYYLITDERILVLNNLIVGDVDYNNNVNIWEKSKPYKRKKKEEKKEEKNFSEKFLENFDVDEILNRVWTENIYESLMYKG